MTRMRRAVIVLAILASACAHDATFSDRLFCGLSIPDGGEVTQQNFDAFLSEVVTPRFPDGFTVWRANGLWRGSSESTIVIEILHPADAQIEKKIQEIAEEYRKRFRQQAVMRVTTRATLKFVE